jgi:membrane-associated protease RseP (regulator of RpoE activity)
MTAYLAVTAVVGALIAIHELGHFLAAKLCGIPVERFSIGMGPKLYAFQRGGTSYWLSAIPIGGYVLPGIEEGEFRELSLSKQIAFALPAVEGLLPQPFHEPGAFRRRQPLRVGRLVWQPEEHKESDQRCRQAFQDEKPLPSV